MEKYTEPHSKYAVSVNAIIFYLTLKTRLPSEQQNGVSVEKNSRSWRLQERVLGPAQVSKRS